MRKFLVGLIGFLFLATAAHAAIQKEVEHQSGVTGNYIYLSRAILNFDNAPSACSVYEFSVYASKEQYDAGKQPLIRRHRTVTWCGAEDPLNSAAINAAGAAVSDGNYYAGIYSSIYAKAVSATAAVHEVTAVADVAGSLNNQSFSFYNQAGEMFAVWFNVDGNGSAPAGGTLFEVAIAANSSAEVVASGIRGAIAASGITVSGTGASVILTQDNTGMVVSPEPNATGFTISETVAGYAAISEYAGGTLVP